MDSTPKIVYKKQIGELCTPAHTGYDFDGWYTAETGGEKITSSYTLNNKQDLSLYSHWIAHTYKIKFNSNTGLGTMNTYDNYCTLSANAFTKDGYDFAGWARSANGEVEFENKESVVNLLTAGELTLYAICNPGDVTIRYHANGGTGTMGNSYFVINTKNILPKNVFTRTDHVFLGWAYSQANANAGIVDKKDGAEITPNGSMDLYAVWAYQKEVRYTDSSPYKFYPQYDGYYLVELVGAAGGYGLTNGKASNSPGTGGYAVGTMTMNAGEKYYIYVGGQGKNGTASPKAGGAGGYDSDNDQGGGGG